MESCRKKLVIALDGPAGVGKSTIAMALAARFGLTYVETGALYRAVGLVARRLGVDMADHQALGRVAAALQVTFRLDGGINRVFLGPEELTALLREPDMGPLASRVSAVPEVRAALLQVQRDFAHSGGVVAEGRDIGTVVFPNADFKFFLDASARERARRRQLQLEAAGRQVDPVALLAEIEERDRQDRTRAIAPLKPADDALVVDTTELEAQGVVAALVSHIEVGQ